MKITDLAIKDGAIIEYKIFDGDLKMIFQDASNYEFEITFYRIYSVHEKGGVGFGLTDMKHINNQVDFYDEDGVVVLSIVAKRYKIHPKLAT